MTRLTCAECLMKTSRHTLSRFFFLKLNMSVEVSLKLTSYVVVDGVGWLFLLVKKLLGFIKDK